MKVSFFENEFEEHNKGEENYQESRASERGTACLPAAAQVDRVLEEPNRVPTRLARDDFHASSGRWTRLQFMRN